MLYRGPALSESQARVGKDKPTESDRLEIHNLSEAMRGAVLAVNPFRTKGLDMKAYSLHNQYNEING